MQIKIGTRTKNILTQHAVRVGLLQRLLHAHKGLVHKLAAHIVVTNGGTHGKTANRHALYHGMWIEAQDIAILASARFTLVRITYRVHLAVESFRHEAPLQAGRKAGTTTTSQS